MKVGDYVKYGLPGGGYTLSLERAGRYTLTDAVRIMSKRSKELGLIPCEIPVPSPELIQELLADENHR